MLFDDDFYIDGVSALSVGIVMQKNFVFEGAKPDVTTVVIPGRNGALHQYTGSYLNIKGTIDCYILSDIAAQNMATLGRFLRPMSGYSRLEIESDAGYFRLARIEGMPDNDVRIQLMAPFTLTFDCMPQHFLTSGEAVQTIASGGTITNPTNQVAEPLITITGTNMDTLTIGSQTIDLNDTTGTIVIDSLRKIAYNVSGDVQTASTLLRGLEFPVLPVGQTGISFTADSATLTIKPNWYEI